LISDSRYESDDCRTALPATALPPAFRRTSSEETPFILTQALGRGMVKRGNGKVIFIASVLSYQGGINGIAPAYVATDNTAALQANSARHKALMDRVPSARWACPRKSPSRWRSCAAILRVSFTEPSFPSMVDGWADSSNWTGCCTHTGAPVRSAWHMPRHGFTNIDRYR